MIDKIREAVSIENRNIREKLFLIMCLEAVVGTMVCLVENILLHAGWLNYVVVASTIVIVCLAVRALVFYGQQELSIGLVTLWMNCVVFPMVFFTCGGVHSGSPAWMAIGAIFVFLVYRGLPLIIFATITLVAYAACYIVAYNNPQWVNPLGSELGIFVDSFLGIAAIAATAALIFAYRRSGYSRESAMLVSQRNELDRITGARERFYANFSHEIRNPINAIVGLNELNLRQSTDPVITKNSEAIGRSGKLLLGIVNDIMDLSQIENESMDLISEPYDLAGVLAELVDLVGIRAQDKGLELSLEAGDDIPKVLVGDERRVIQLLLNILTNAVKYTEKGSIKLSVLAEKKEGEKVHLKFVVADTGMGIKKEDMARLFDTYSQFDRVNNNFKEGNGLGLPIAYQLAKAMHGDIKADSVYGKGSTFTIEIEQGFLDGPVLETLTFDGLREGLESGSGYSRSFEASKARILVVDDDEQNRSIITGLLKDTKVQVTEASSGEEALMYTAVNEYHVIFVDYVMPGMSGTELLEAIRTQSGGKCRKSRIIALTGANLEQREHYNAVHGFDLILNKPVEYTVLEKVVADSLPAELIEYRRPDEEISSSRSKINSIQKKKRRVRITVESAADLSEDITDKYDIGIMHLYIKTEKGRFRDMKEIDISDTMGHLTKDHRDISTAGAEVFDYEDFFKKELENSEEIIHISLGGVAGHGYQYASEAAQSFSHVRIVDSCLVSAGAGLLAIIAAGWASEGIDTEGILSGIAEIKRHIEFKYVLPSAAVAAQTGRIGKSRAAVYDRLDMHPVMHSGHSHVRQVGAFRGPMEKVVVRHVKTTMAMGGRMEMKVPIIIDNMGMDIRLLGRVESTMYRFMPRSSVLITTASVTSVCYSGMGALGIAYLRGGHLDRVEAMIKKK